MQFQKQGNLRGLILDLRDNPGGLLESAVDVSAKFLPTGSVIVTTRGRDSSEQRVYRSSEEPMATNVPLVVLVNGGSASASEIVAGAIQDMDAGVIVGTQSFGKGLVQSIRRMPHDATLKMTTARYYTPSGRCIQKIDYMQQRLGLTSTMADTLRSRYLTRIGRTVFERGGITPDTVIEMPDTAAMVSLLRNSSAFFKFATRYTSGLKALPEDFRVSDSLMQQFETFIISGPPEILNDPLMNELKELEVLAARESYGETVTRKLASLRAELSSEQRRAFIRNREEIRRELYNEIVGRFHGQRQRLEAAIPRDHQLQSAVALLRSGRNRYGQILSVR
jgi:carboxyl-terminal processing protease